jgi:hypothetical protein
MRYVRVDAASVVAEVGEFESIEGRFHPSLLWIASGTAQVGDLWDGAQFAAPPAPSPAAPIVPSSVTRRQGMAVLIMHGLDTQIESALQQQLTAATNSGDANAIRAAKLALNDFHESQTFERSWPLISQMQQAFGWTDAYVDSLFIEARSL